MEQRKGLLSWPTHVKVKGVLSCLFSILWRDLQTVDRNVINMFVFYRTYIVVVYSSPDISHVIILRGIRWAGKVSHLGEMKSLHLVWFEWQNPLVRRTCKWESSIKVAFQEIWWKGLDSWSVSGWGQFVGCWEHGNEPLVCIKCGEFCGYVRN
jgi:hypothetical protein